LEQLQNEKRAMLLDHEKLKMQQFDEEYGAEVKLFKSQLKPRKQALEDKCTLELQAEEQFYQMGSTVNGSSASVSSLSAGYAPPQANVITSQSSIRQPLAPM